MSPKKWIETTDAIGIASKAGRYGGTGLVLTLIVILQIFMTDFMKHINY